MGITKNVLFDVEIGVERVNWLVYHFIYLVQLFFLQEESQGLKSEQLPSQEVDLVVLALYVKQYSLQLDLVIEVVVFDSIKQVVDGEDGDAASHDVEKLEWGIFVLSLKDAQLIFERL